MTGDYVLETVFECNDDVINGYHEIACRVKMTNIDFIRFNAQQFITNMLTNTNRIFLLVCSILVYYLMRDMSLKKTVNPGKLKLETEDQRKQSTKTAKLELGDNKTSMTSIEATTISPETATTKSETVTEYHTKFAAFRGRTKTSTPVSTTKYQKPQLWGPALKGRLKEMKQKMKNMPHTRLSSVLSDLDTRRTNDIENRKSGNVEAISTTNSTVNLNRDTEIKSKLNSNKFQHSNSTAIKPKKLDLEQDFLEKLFDIKTESDRTQAVDQLIAKQPDKSIKSKMLKNKFYMNKLKHLAALGYRKAADYWPDHYAKYYKGFVEPLINKTRNTELDKLEETIVPTVKSATSFELFTSKTPIQQQSVQKTESISTKIPRTELNSTNLTTKLHHFTGNLLKNAHRKPKLEADFVETLMNFTDIQRKTKIQQLIHSNPNSTNQATRHLFYVNKLKHLAALGYKKASDCCFPEYYSEFHLKWANQKIKAVDEIYTSKKNDKLFMK